MNSTNPHADNAPSGKPGGEADEATATGTPATTAAASPDPVDSRPGGIGLLMTVLITAAVAFQLNASMLSPVLATMARELSAAGRSSSSCWA